MSHFVGITYILTFEVEISVGWDYTTSTPSAVAIIAGNVKHSFLPYRHFHHAFVPPADHLSNSDSKGEWPSAVTACVELRPIRGKCSTVWTDIQ